MGCGNGGLQWKDVRVLIEAAFRNSDIAVSVYEPVATYMAEPKKTGVEELTPARALLVEAIRRYWVLGLGCTNLEVQKLAWFLQRCSAVLGIEDTLQLRFTPNRYGPYADNLRHLLDNLDGGYLKCTKRLSDAGPNDTIWFNPEFREKLEQYLGSEQFAPYKPVLDLTTRIIDGFESPLGMEVLATIDWTLEHSHDHIVNAEDFRKALLQWPAGAAAAQRKMRLFGDRILQLGLDRVLHVLASKSEVPV